MKSPKRFGRKQQEMDERDEAAIGESLRTVPGLRVQQLGGPGSFTSIKTRGLRNEDTAVLIDGLRFRDAAAPQGDASGFLEDLIVTDVSRVEVLRGSGSSLYGSNAIGGVINLVTDEGGGPLHGNLLAEGGGLGMFRGRAQLAGGSLNDTLVYAVAFHINVTRASMEMMKFVLERTRAASLSRHPPPPSGTRLRSQLPLATNNSPAGYRHSTPTVIIEASAARA